LGIIQKVQLGFTFHLVLKMGLNSSKLEKAMGPQFPEGEHYFGLENVSRRLNEIEIFAVWKHLL
jgi:hypothetical protein